MEFADANPSVGVYPSSVAHAPMPLSGLPGLVSVNSALEVDLAGQVNAETIQGRRISGVGGSYDFAEAATHSRAGLRVIALPAKRIVRQLAAGSTVTVPSALVDVIVTEKGVARLEGMTEQERAQALSAISEGGT
jgi:acyl-CoA hydrolase